MTSIAAPRSTFIPFDEEEEPAAKRHARVRARAGTAWALLPALAILAVAGTAYISQTARGTALTYEIASLQAQKAALGNTSSILAQQIGQAESAGAVNQTAVRLGYLSPTGWQVLTPPPGPDPLLPVLLALKGA